MLNTIDLFAGCGGLTEGFKQSGMFNFISGIEWDKDALATLRHRLKYKWGYKNAKELAIYFDIQRTNEFFEGFSNDEQYGSCIGLNKLIGEQKVDAIIGGPPCQAYSIAGRIRDEHGMQNDYRNYLFESYIKVVDKVRPKACIFENVPGMLNAAPGGISIVERITQAFNLIGYSISSDLANDALFNVADYGVPQNRRRVIIVAVNNEAFPNPIEAVKEFYRTLNSNKSVQFKTVHESIGDLPHIYPLANPEKRKSHYVKKDLLSPTILDHRPRYHNPRDVSIFRLLAEDIENETFKYKSAQALQELYTAKTGRASAVHKYYVLRRDRPSNTIPAHLYKDGLRHIHYDSKQARSITVREAARLQSFPDDFEFLGSNGSKYKMIGNAVPPLFAKKIAIALAEIIKRK